MTSVKHNTPRPLSRIFAVPLMIGVASAIGLSAALIGNGAWDVVGWFGLGTPLAVTAWCFVRRRTT